MNHSISIKPKYGNKKTVVDGFTFDSRAEAKRYQELKLLDRAGQITGLELQPGYDILINGIKVCSVILDFRYFDKYRDQEVIEDVKGHDNALSRLKRKLVEAKYGFKVEVRK